MTTRYTARRRTRTTVRVLRLYRTEYGKEKKRDAYMKAIFTSLRKEVETRYATERRTGVIAE